MLGLQLREEFRGRRLKGTAIDFNDEIEKSPDEFLEITYPTGDLIKLLKSVEIGQDRPVVLMGERGQGKSHLMVALYHAFKSTDKTKQWLQTWSNRIETIQDFKLNLRPNMIVIAESLQRQNYKYLWDILLDKHPYGQYIQGKWDNMGEKKTDILSYDLLIEMFKKQPTVLIFDEFQTWYDGLTNSKQYPWRHWAFTFIQNLSEISKTYPELLTLVVSVRNGETDAYQQIHRINPILVDFKGETSKRDRKRLLIHRLFENRRQVPDDQISILIETHVREYFRLMVIPETEHDRIRKDFIETWPFASHMMNLLEDQVLVATDAQETRDLIRILANLFKRNGDKAVIITAAHFTVNDDKSGVSDLLDSVANHDNIHLKDKAIRNMEAVRDAIKRHNEEVPHLQEIISSLWVRSLSVDRIQGAEPYTIQVDITQNKRIDDNSFQIELQTITENSFNIHQIGNRLVFKNEENPRAKLMAYSRNDKLFSKGEDIDQLAKEINYMLLGSSEVAAKFNVIVLKKNWRHNPWEELSENERIVNSDERIPVIVMPYIEENMDRVLGEWIKDNVIINRNTIRFLLPKENVYTNREFIILSRAILKSNEWQGNEPVYSKLYKDFQKELGDKLNTLFDKYAILQTWNFVEPSKCKFIIEKHGAQGGNILGRVNESVSQNIFVPEDFENIVMEYAKRNDSAAKLIKDLHEPRPNEEECIPWIGEINIKEKLIRICARGDIAIILRGTEYLIKQPEETEEESWNRMKGKLGYGKYLEDTLLILPDAIPSTGGQITINVGGAGNITLNGGLETIYVGNNGYNNGYEGTKGPTLDGIDNGSSNRFGNIFSKSEDINKKNKKMYSSNPTSSLNLLGRMEQWEVGPGTNLYNIKINIENMTGAQIQALLKSLPDGIAYGLELEKEE